MSDSNDSTENSPANSFFLKHEFAIRRLHSLLGIVPLGLYMVIHLATNASFINGTQTFQRAVFLIHSPGNLLPIIEWTAIFMPLVFHAVVGIWISKTGSLNSQQYKFVSNKRYVIQRVTGIIALVFLFFHILHLHGWFHAGFWIDSVRALGMGNFRPYNAGSTLASAMSGFLWPLFYLIGVLSCVYHLANGLWTAGITWGLWISPKAQERATKVCVAFGAVLAVISITAWWAAVSPNADDIAEMEKVENRMHDAAIEGGLIPDMPEKRSQSESVSVPTNSKPADDSTSSTESTEPVKSVDSSPTVDPQQDDTEASAALELASPDGVKVTPPEAE